jgi:hypothetical protein
VRDQLLLTSREAKSGEADAEKQERRWLGDGSADSQIANTYVYVLNQPPVLKIISNAPTLLKVAAPACACERIPNPIPVRIALKGMN